MKSMVDIPTTNSRLQTEIYSSPRTEYELDLLVETFPFESETVSVESYTLSDHEVSTTAYTMSAIATTEKWL